MNTEIEIVPEYRPCYVNGKKALFHRWADKDQPFVWLKCKVQDFKGYNQIVEKVGQYVVGDARTNLKMQRVTLAIVEFEDGTVAEVEPSEVRFADNKINEYAFDFNFDKHCQDEKKGART